METLVTIIHVVVALFMVLVVLVQGGNAGGVGAAFGSGNSSGLFGASGANTFLTRLTYGAALIFMISSILLTILQGQSTKTGLMNKLESANSGPATMEPAAPAQPVVPANERPGAEPATAPDAPAQNAQPNP